MPDSETKAPRAQQSTSLIYKNGNTVKTLIRETPEGLIICMVAQSISDRQIVERFNLFSLCDPGDPTLADKGFNVQDLLLLIF